MSISELQLALLGGLQLSLGAQELTDHISTKGQALLCYLALTNRLQSRGIIAGLLWGDKPETAARRSLRVELSKLRSTIGDHMVISRQYLGLNTDQSFWSDVLAFENYLRMSRQREGASDPALLQEAVKLYRGDFLSGFDARDALPFEEWMLSQRERLHQMAVNALDTLVEHFITQRSFAAGIEYAQRLLLLDAWRETAHRQLMWLLAYSGQRNAALAQFETCRKILKQELGVKPQAETVALYEKIREMEKSAALQTKELPPLPPQKANPFQAPAQAPYFTGREAEVAQLSGRLLAEEGNRRIALVGMGGIGKSTLALHLAHHLRDQFSGGVLWAHAGTGDPTAIIENWAEAYGYDFSGLPDLPSRAAALQQILAEREALLILDDVRHAARVRPLLPPAGSGSSVLMTTRNYDLAHSLKARVVPVQVPDDDSARELLVRIIGDSRAAAEEAAVSEICQQLQNLPLAVAIVAQRLASRPRRRLQDVLAQLRDEHQRLGQLTRPDQAVRASFAVSWRGLDQVQRRIFTLLAIFYGRAFTASAMAAVADIDRYGAMDRLDALVTLSLLQEAEENYYRQHTLLADYSRERLDDLKQPARRMVKYYLTFARQHQQQYAALRPEWENISASVQMAYEQEMWPSILEFTNLLRTAWFARGRYDAARKAYRRAIGAATKLKDRQAQANILLNWGQASLEQSDFDEAEKKMLQSLAIFQELGETAGTGDAKYHLARIALEKAESDRAEKLLAESGRLRKELGDWAGLAEIIYTQARIHYRRAELEAAVSCGEQALQMQEEADDQSGMIRTLRLLTNITSFMKEYATAEDYGKRAVALCEELGERSELAVTLRVVATLHRGKGEYDRAEALAQESLQLLQQIGDRRAQALVYYELMLLNSMKESYQSAIDMGCQGLAISRKLGAHVITSWILIYLGKAYQMSGKQQQAENSWAEAEKLAQKLANDRMITVLQEMKKD